MAGSNILAQVSDQQKMMTDWAESRRLPSGIVIPKTAIPVFAYGFVTPAAASYGTQIQLVQYQTKANWYSLICGIVLQFSGTGQGPNAGDVSYVVDVDVPLGDFGETEKDYNGVPFVLGTFAPGEPWPCEFKHNDGEILRIKATPVANMSLGPGNNLVGALLGWEWPADRM